MRKINKANNTFAENDSSSTFLQKTKSVHQRPKFFCFFAALEMHIYQIRTQLVYSKIKFDKLFQGVLHILPVSVFLQQ